MTLTIEPCKTPEDFERAMTVARDYVKWLGFDLSFQNIDEEFEGFSTVYGEPEGVFLLARVDGRVAGGVGLRRLTADMAGGVCEMKRLYVYDRFGSQGVGRALCVRLIEEARGFGYRRVRLDTIARLEGANALYVSLGFTDIDPYNFNPDPTVRYMELKLG